MNMQFEAGALLRPEVRRLLEKAQFTGHLRSYKEIKRLLSSEFLLKGASFALARAIKAWADDLERSDA